MKRVWLVAVVGVLFSTSLAVVAVGGTRHDPFGTVGRPLPLFLPLEEFFTDDYIDSGCMLVNCSADCVQYDTGYKCWGRAIYERYGYSGPGQREPLPIQVDVVVTCKVVVFQTQSCTASDSSVGSGRVTAYDDCWINQILSGLYWVDSGGCACTEL